MWKIRLQIDMEGPKSTSLYEKYKSEFEQGEGALDPQ